MRDSVFFALIFHLRYPLYCPSMKFLPHLDVDSMVFCPILRAICRLWHPLPQGDGISYLYIYRYIVYAILPSPYMAIDNILPVNHIGGINVLNWRLSSPKYIKLKWTLTKYLQHTSVPGQQSLPTGSGLRPSVTNNINQHDTQPNICNRRWVSHDLFRVLSTFVVILQGSSRLFPIYAVVQQIFSNRSRKYLKYNQPTLRLLNLAPWLFRDRIKYWLLMVIRHACRKLFSVVSSENCLPVFLW